MEQSLADLLTDAFAETSIPSFTDDDLDFESLDLDENISCENVPTKKEGALHQEATDATVLSRKESLDVYKAENVDVKKDFQGAGVMSMDEMTEEDYTSSGGESGEEGSVSGENEEDEEEGTGEKRGDVLMPVHCGDEFYDGNKEDRIFAERQPLAPEGTENPQVRNKDQGESDEEVSYFERVPGRGGEMMIRGDGIEEDKQEREKKKQDSYDSECEDVKIEQEHFLAQRFEQEVENPYRDEPAEATLEFPGISVENLQDLNAEADTEENVERINDFSGDEHQQAGESFADYPSDFSSCEYVEDRGKNQENYQLNASPCASDLGANAKQNTCLERAVTDITWMRDAEDTDDDVGDGYLYSTDLEMDADRFMGLAVAKGEKIEIVEHALDDTAVTWCDDGSETSESESYSSSDNEFQVRKSDEEFSYNVILQDPENNKQLEDTRLQCGSSAEFSRRSVSDDRHIAEYYNRPDSTADCTLFQDPLTTEDSDRAETLSSRVIQWPTEDVNSYLAIQRTTSPSNQGSLDDSFFFDTELEASATTELGQLGDDEYEDDRNWEKEQERIKAFYRFYNDGENGREERQIKVQFCTELLSQVIHYDTDSTSDRDSLSSSTDGEEHPNSAVASEELTEPDDILQVEPACDPPNSQLPHGAPDLRDTQFCSRKHTCLTVLKLTLMMGLVILMGLLMFWLVTDQADWLSHVHFF
ncbi:hypothetical protein PAMA_021846 [Pampus argenteus]